MKISLPDYIKIASGVKRKKVSVEEREVENALSWLQKSRAKFTLKSGPCQKGDWVEIEYYSPQIEELIKDRLLTKEENKKGDEFILGEGHLIPGFEEEIEGMEGGQEKEFSLVFPENHFRKDLAGKKIDFHLNVKSVQKMEIPEVNDQFTQDLGRFENLAALKNSIREEINLEKENQESFRVRQEILDKINQNSELEIPEDLIFKEQKLMMEILKTDTPKKLGISFEEYLSGLKKSEEEVFQSLLAQAKERVKKLLILREISERENIEAKEEEVLAEVNKTIKYLEPDEVKKLDQERLKDYTKEAIKQAKALARLESFAKN